MRKNKTLLAACFVAICALGFATTAPALTLADLNAGASFSTPDGTLTFHDFSVSTSGAGNAFAGLDLSLIEVEALPSVGFGFKVLQFDAPLVVAGDQFGNLEISYTVTANDLAAITGVGLRFTGTAMGTGAVARIDELVSTSAGNVELHAIREAGGTQDPDDSSALPAPVQEIGVWKSVTLDVSSSTAFLAQISEFEQRYSVAPIPEPGAFAIFAASLALVTTASRRRLL